MSNQKNRFVAKAEKEIQEMNARREQAYAKTPKEYHAFIVMLEQNKNLGKPFDNEQLPEEARKMGLWMPQDRKGVYLPISSPYMTVDGRLQWARDEHRQAGKKLDIDTWYDPDTKCFRTKIVSEIHGTATGSATVNIGGSGVDRTHPMENAESSAIGRALSFLGYGLIGTGIASADEVESALVENRRLDEQAARGTTEEPASPSETKANTEQSQRRSNQNQSQSQGDKSGQGRTQAPQQENNSAKGKFVGPVLVKSIQFPESEKGVYAELEAVSEQGEPLKLIAAQGPVFDAIDQLDIKPEDWLIVSASNVRGHMLLSSIRAA